MVRKAGTYSRMAATLHSTDKPLRGKKSGDKSPHSKMTKLPHLPGHPCRKRRRGLCPVARPAAVTAPAAGQIADRLAGPQRHGDPLRTGPGRPYRRRDRPMQLSARGQGDRTCQRLRHAECRKTAGAGPGHGHRLRAGEAGVHGSPASGGNPSGECAKDRLHRQLPGIVRCRWPDRRGHRPLGRGPKTRRRHAGRTGRRGRTDRPDRRCPRVPGFSSRSRKAR